MGARRFDPLTMFDIPKRGGGQLIAINGPDLFVDTVRGTANATGLSWDKSISTIEEALDRLNTPLHYKLPGNRKGSNARIYAIGDIREQAVEAPVGVYGVKIIGAFAGRPRHSTSGGVVLEGNGCSWREASTAENAPLLKLREQGWEIWNICMIPESGYSAVQLRCNEDATDPDASHFILGGSRLISSGTRVGYGLEDIGGMAHIGVYGNEFTLLEYAWKQTSVGIRSPQDHEWFDNKFSGCKTDIALNAQRCHFKKNKHFTKYDGTNHPTTLNLALTADAGDAVRPNKVEDCDFADAAADVTIAKGYKPATGDIWRYRVAATAADIVTVPS